jgi:hypothetical protein
MTSLKEQKGNLESFNELKSVAGIKIVLYRKEYQQSI